MKTVKVVAVQDHTYDSVQHKTGDSYDALRSDVELLVQLGKVKLERKESVPEESAPEPPKKGEYRRRDLKAQK